MTKEEIQGQYDLIIDLGLYNHFPDSVIPLLAKLKIALKEAKSIKDLQREAFEAGKSAGIDLICDPRNADFTFEDYLKSLKNGTTKEI